jgi:hypothetical protein
MLRKRMSFLVPDVHGRGKEDEHAKKEDVLSCLTSMVEDE